MVSLLLNSPPQETSRTRPGGVPAAGVVALLLASAWACEESLAQTPPPRVHQLYSGNMPPGAIGRLQRERSGPLQGYSQPVQLQAPDGVMVSAAEQGTFGPPEPAPVTVGLLIGEVYRFRVTNIPQNVGQELFPTVEVIDRLYPPPGCEIRFPIPIELTREELALALAGKLVTRVIYLEDPKTALPRREDPRHQRYVEVLPHEDPLHVADAMGRPMAILRLGSRVPDAGGPDETFLYGSPPLIRYGNTPLQPQRVAAQPTGAPPINSPANVVAPSFGPRLPGLLR